MKHMVFLALMLVSFLSMPVVPARAHCDTLDGPVIMDAKLALEKGDVTPVLKWVKKADEGRIREAFKQALSERALSAGNAGRPSGKNPAEMKFYETLVKVHRAGEGAEFTGIRPPGSEVEPSIQEADKALQSGAVAPVVSLVSRKLSEGIRSRYAKAYEKKKHADESVEAGRDYVRAYVEFIHYVEELDKAASPAREHHSSEASAAATAAAEAPERR